MTGLPHALHHHVSSTAIQLLGSPASFHLPAPAQAAAAALKATSPGLKQHRSNASEPQKLIKTRPMAVLTWGGVNKFLDRCFGFREEGICHPSSPP